MSFEYGLRNGPRSLPPSPPPLWCCPCDRVPEFWSLRYTLTLTGIEEESDRREGKGCRFSLGDVVEGRSHLAAWMI